MRRMSSRASLVFVVLTIIQGGFFIAVVERWASSGWWDRPVFALGLLVPFLIGLAMFEARWLTLPLMRVPRWRPPAPGWRVGVATTFVPAVESLDMLERTVAALVAMPYAHDTWVLDEGDDADVRRLCARLGARHHTRRGDARRNTPAGLFAARTKHGNYNAWLADEGYDRYDVIVNVDPDHVVEPVFLERLLGHLDDPAVAYVQAAQAYYNQPASLVAQGAAEETYAYYSSVQMSSYALGYPIVTGCHTVHRTAALREIGGFAPHEADDLLITVLYRAAGWQGVYVPEILARGLTPVDWPAYLRQQRRWARSVLDVKLRWFPRLAGRLPRVERAVSMLHGLYYLHGIGSALSLAVLSWLLVRGTDAEVDSGTVLTTVGLTMLVLQACELFRQHVYLQRSSEWGLHLRGGLVRFAKWPWVMLALADAIAGQDRGYTITPKAGAARRSTSVAAVHLSLAGLVVAAVAIGSATGAERPGVLLVAAAGYVALSLVVAWTALRPPVPAYDAELAARTFEVLPVAA